MTRDTKNNPKNVQYSISMISNTKPVSKILKKEAFISEIYYMGCNWCCYFGCS